VRLLWAATFGAIYDTCRQARLVGYLARSGVRRHSLVGGADLHPDRVDSLRLHGSA
jgi:hypothetical protein